MLVIREHNLAKIGNLDPFCTFCHSISQFDVVTLNHDLVLEELQVRLKLPTLDDGFSKVNSNLKNDLYESISVFNGHFELPNRLVKLHGSIDLYRYVHSLDKRHLLFTNGEVTYFKTSDYHEKQSPYRIAPATGEIVQTVHFDISPKFITGTKKEEILNSDPLYKSLFTVYKSIIKEHHTIVVIGYSFGDAHVDEVLRAALKTRKIRKVVNVNPYQLFPYSEGNCEIINLKKIDELESAFV